MTIFLNSTVGLLWASIFAAVGIFGIYLRAWRRSVSASENDLRPTKATKSNAIKSLLEDTDFLYTETGLFIKCCYTNSVKTGGSKSFDLHKQFKKYKKVLKGQALHLPQEIELKMFRLFDILFEYKRKGDSIVSSTKIPNRYKDQQKLEQEFTNEVSSLYSEIEVELRKIFNKETT